MQFGRLDDISGVDFTLPPDAPGTTKLLKELKKNKQEVKVYAGCPVWADKGLTGKIYPKGTKSDKYLFHYCQQFNAVEVNATAYNLPTREGILRWKESAVPGFKYCPKFPQFITHRRDIDKKDAGLDRFLTLMYELDEHLGPSLFQLPPHFKPQRMMELYRFLESMPEDFEIAVEVRHPDWYNTETVQKEYFDMLRGLKRTAVIADVAGRRDVLHMNLTSDTAFIRFNGDNLVPTDFSRTSDWVQRLHEWAQQGVKHIYFFPHTPDKHKSADLSAYFIEEWNNLTGGNMKGPEFLNKPKGGLFG